MPTVAYPAIPFLDDPSAHDETGPEGNVLRTPMDQGPSKARRRFTAASRKISGRTDIMTNAEVDTFETWYDDTVKGVNSFTAIHPRTGVQETFRFLKDPPYKIVYLHDDKNRIEMELEVLP